MKLLIAVLVVTFGLCQPVAYSSLFTPLGDLPGGGFSSHAHSISPSGFAVVGQSESEYGTEAEAFLWTMNDGMIGLGDLPGGSFRSVASDVSVGGSVIVGSSYSSLGASEAFRWSQDTGMVGLGDFPGGHFNSTALAVSLDGTVVVGHGTVGTLASSINRAFRWTEEDGLLDIGSIPGYDQSEAKDVSADGLVIVGVSHHPSKSRAFIWTEDSGMIGLSDFSGGYVESNAQAVSEDGRIVVGQIYTDLGAEAMIWSEETGMIGIGDLPGGEYDSIAYGISADGSVVVGRGQTDALSEAFVWDEDNGMLNLRHLLINNGETKLCGWKLGQAMGVSADGTIVIGDGINPEGNREAWLAVVPNAILRGADFNRDGDIDQSDFEAWQAGFGKTCACHKQGDTDYDLDVDGNDFLTWQQEFSGGFIASTSIPEPSTLTLISLLTFTTLAIARWRMIRKAGC